MRNVSYDFRDRVAVVTGGSNGIGAAIAQTYREAGAKVFVWDLEAPDDGDSTDHFYPVDVADLSTIEKAAERTMRLAGRIDFLSHNAGFAGATVPVSEYDPTEWQSVIDVNLTGTFRVCRTLVPIMRQAGYGRIVNMASLAGKEGTPNASAYSAAKAGVIAFTKSLSKELAETGIRVNCLAPAAIRTAILDQMTPEFVRIMIDKSPMKRLGTVEEAAEMVM